MSNAPTPAPYLPLPPDTTQSNAATIAAGNAAPPPTIGQGQAGYVYGQGYNPWVDPNGGPGGATSYATQLGTLANGFLQQQAQDPSKGQFGQALYSDQANQQTASNVQMQNLDNLYDQATGMAANPADKTIQLGLQQQQAMQMALAHSAGAGSGGALAARNAQYQNAVGGINAANSQSQADAQYRAAAAQQLAQESATYGEQGLQQIGNAQQYGTGYGQLQEEQQVQNAQNQVGAQQLGQNILQGQLASQSNLYTAQSQANTNEQAANNAASNQMVTNGISGGVGAVKGVFQLVSDERKKTGIRRESLADRFLDHLEPYSYQYDNPEDEPSLGAPTGGRYLGVMAQDVERTPEVGRQLVQNTPRGKVLNGPATMSALAAGVGRLHERLKALEEERSRMKGGDDART